MRTGIIAGVLGAFFGLTLPASALHPHDGGEAQSACAAPAPAADDMLVFFGGYEGSAISSVSVVGQDRETDAARLIIEEGDTPLYIMAASYEPMIWQIEGATDRVAQFVTARNRNSGDVGAGVTGLPGERVTFLESGCLRYFYKLNSKGGLTAREKWSDIAGRAPDVMHGSYTINSISLPSGESQKKNEPGFDDIINLESEYSAFDFKVDGVAKIHPDTVVAPGPVETYEILPSRAGVQQLLATGHLERTKKGLRIVKPFARFPSGLTGAHSVKFILPDGMAMPAGNPGHSAVVRENDAACLSLLCD